MGALAVRCLGAGRATFSRTLKLIGLNSIVRADRAERHVFGKCAATRDCASASRSLGGSCGRDPGGAVRSIEWAAELEPSRAGI